MKNILSIDTTTDFYYIGLYYKNNLFKFSSKCNFNYLDKILYNIDYFLHKNNVSINDINIIVCVNGPGNFTSTKIGVCISQGLSYGVDIPIIKISSLESLAESSYSIYKNDNNIISMINGYSKLIYWSSFYISNDKLCISKFNKLKLTYMCDIVNYINKFNKKYIISGNAYIKYISKLFNSNVIFSGIKFQRIEDTINLSLKLINTNKFSKLENLFPIY